VNMIHMGSREQQPVVKEVMCSFAGMPALSPSAHFSQRMVIPSLVTLKSGSPRNSGTASSSARIGATHGTYWRRKKPMPFVMNRYCEFVTSVGLNNPPGQFDHVPPRSGSN